MCSELRGAKFSPAKCSELQTRILKTANKPMKETTLFANKGGLKTTLSADNVVSNLTCLRFEAFMFAVRNNYLQFACLLVAASLKPWLYVLLI